MYKLGILIILAFAASVGTFTGKFWLYDRDTTREGRDDIKILLALLDVIKDAAIYFIILSYLLK